MSVQTGANQGNPQRARLATMAAFCINGGAIAAWAANIPSVREHLHLTEQILGYSLLAPGIGSGIALAVAGRLIHQYGSRTVTIATAAVLIASIPLLVSAPSLLLLILALSVYGFCASMMDVAMNAHGVLVERRLDRPIMSSLHAFWSGGSLGAAWLATLLLKAGVSPLVFTLLVAAVLVGFLVFAWPNLLPSSSDKGGEDEEKPVFVIPTGVLLGISILVMLAYVAEGAIADWSAVYVRDSLHTDRGLAVGGFVAFNLAMVLARVVGDDLRRRFNSVMLVRVSGILAALGMAIALAAPTPLLAFVGFALTGFGLSNVVPVLFSAAGNTPGMATGTAVAAATSAGYLGFLVGPPLVGTLAAAVTLRGALFLVVIFAVLIALFAGMLKGTSSGEKARQA